jgi:hypothetical protein
MRTARCNAIDFRTDSRASGIRRGVSTLLVMALLSMTLALAYAMVRLNFTVERTQTNYHRLGDSRQAAYAGLSAALRKMQQSGWSGVDVNLTGTLNVGLSYTVTFQTGDASLTSSSPDYSELPYRVTVTSTGTAADPTNPSVNSSYRVQAIVRLVPRKLNDPPANWNGLQNYTLYQWSSSTDATLSLDLPVQIKGSVFAQNEVLIGPTSPTDGSPLPFAGQMDEVAILGKDLSDAQILSLYQGTATISGIVALGGYYPITWLNFNESTPAFVAQDHYDQYDGLYDGGKPGGSPAPVNGGSGSATFDGYNDHIHLGAIDVTGSALTIVAWIKPSSFPSDSGRIIAKASGTESDDQYWTLSHYLSNGRRCLRFYVKTNSGGTSTLSATNVNLTAGQWTHIAAVYDGSRLKVYQNGQLMNQMSKSGGLSTSSSAFVSLGNSPSGSPRAKLLRDLAYRRLIEGVDHRPLTGSITAPISKTSAAERSLVTDELQLTWNDTPITGTAPFSHPGTVSSYQLYPGGKSYSVPNLGSTLRNVTLGPDPETNPLGVFYRIGSLDVRENVNITGVLIVNANDSTPDIEIYGQDVHFHSVALPSVYGSSAVKKLPAAIVKDDLRFYYTGSGEIDGLIMAWGELGFLWRLQASTFTITGRAITNKFYVQPTWEWYKSDSWWKARLKNFLSDLTDSNPILYFPAWLDSHEDVEPSPRIVVQPPSNGDSYHWHDWSKPVFAAHPDDGGLRWEVIALRELP